MHGKDLPARLSLKILLRPRQTPHNHSNSLHLERECPRSPTSVVVVEMHRVRQEEAVLDEDVRVVLQEHVVA